MPTTAQATDTERIGLEACGLIFYELDNIMFSNKTVSLPEKALNNLI